MKWFSTTEKLPAHDGEVLVWTGSYFIVSAAYVYTPEQRAEYAEWIKDPKPFMGHFTDKDKKHFLECTGYFEEFGQKHYFDNPKVMWQELPEKPNG